ncbi:hypothetical protein FJTKL_00305 [Diaporthe vaccinii]|uniref:Uncharacterized protein n=1 Tax=Diaporthe vaccinii TaxID=105482 RepID=A0ABR4E3P8_9PEZI
MAITAACCTVAGHITAQQSTAHQGRAAGLAHRGAMGDGTSAGVCLLPSLVPPSNDEHGSTESPDPEFPNTSPPFPFEEDGLDEPPPLSVPVEPDPSAPPPMMMLMVESICCVMFFTSVSSCWYNADAGCLTCKLSVLTRSAGYVATAMFKGNLKPSWISTVPSGMGKVPVSGVMALGRLLGKEVADVAVSPPVTVLVDGATMMVVGNQDSDESVIVEIGTKLLPRLSEDTVVMLGRVAEEVVVASSVVGGELVSVSVAGTVALGGSVTVVGNSAVVVPDSAEVEFWDTVASVVVGSKVEVLKAVVGRSEMVVLAVIGISVGESPSLLVTVVPLPISVALGRGVVAVVMPVPGPVAEGSTVSTDDVDVAEMMVVPVPGPVADASIVDTVVGDGVEPVPGPVTEASIVDSADVAEVTPVPGPVADGSTL